MNAPGFLRIPDEQKVQLTMMAVELVRRLDPRTPVFVSFDQPWAEYMAFEETDLSPLHFADLLVRADLGIAGLGLEINYGFWPGGTFPRDILDISEQIDFWALLGLPLITILSIPSSGAEDQLACRHAGRPLAKASPDGLSPQSQKRVVEQILPVLLAKQSVHAVVWNQVFDASVHQYANAGVFDANHRPKPALSSLIALRRDHLD
jgi:hypothetical protein